MKNFLHVGKCLIISLLLTVGVYAEPRLPGLERASIHEGLILWNELQCSACHEQGVEPIPPRSAPILSNVFARVRADYLEKFIAQPVTGKPGTVMPHVLKTPDDANAIVHFLASINRKEFKTETVDPSAAKRGEKFFHSVGCVVCHSPRNELGQETMMDDSVPLGDLGGKYTTVQALTEFLEDPLHVRPSGRMPNMKLGHWEAHDLASYLFGKTSQPIRNEPFKMNTEQAARGKKVFQQDGCIQCHPLQGLSASAKRAITNPANGCLSASAGGWPDYGLNDRQRNALKGFLSKKPAELSPLDQLDLTLVSLNCIACHARGELGGVEQSRIDFFQTDDMNLGEAGRIPPPLTNVGAKLQKPWLRKVLLFGESVRSYMNTRMPMYGEQNVSHLTDLFDQVDQLKPAPFGDQVKDLKETRKIGHQLVGNKGMNCMACHGFNEYKAEAMQAVKLDTMGARIKKDWLYHYLVNPQRFRSNIVMPTFWPMGMTIRKDILDGDANRQMQAVWLWMLEGRQARTPSGYRREPLELVVKDEARLLRRSAPGIAKRGISVGYPGGMNLIFDARQMRLGWVWKGRFIDASSVWYGQGQGSVHIVEGEKYPFPKGPAFAKLATVKTAWPEAEGKIPGYQFKGYRLDAKQRPTFLYRFENMEIEDFFLNTTAADGTPVLKRSILLRVPEATDTLYFRVAQGKTITVSPKGVFLVDKKLAIDIWNLDVGMVRPVEKGQELILPFEVEKGIETELVLDYRIL